VRLSGNGSGIVFGLFQSFVPFLFLSANFLSPPNTLAFGTPIPSAPGPAALASIGINLEFTLTPGDSASFTSIFVVEPIPEPNTFALVALGLVGLAARRGRRSAR